MPWRMASRLLRSWMTLSLARISPASGGFIPNKDRASSVRPDPSLPVMPRISPGTDDQVDAGILSLASQTPDLQSWHRVGHKRRFEAGFKDLACDEFAQSAPVDVADPVGAYIAAVP